MYDNYHYPAGADNEWAPWNQPEVPEKEFDITISQSLSKDTTVTTNDYVPGASGVDYEPDDEGGYCACGWQDKDDTFDTDWKGAYEGEHLTPLQLIDKFKDLLMSVDSQELKDHPCIKYKEYYIKECSDWINDETEVVEN